MRRKLTVGSCFSGIGGLELGLEWTGGFETKWQIENDPYASRVLAKHWPNVRRYEDITTVEGGYLEPVDVICGGFPCQDVSLAGTRKGLEGKRTTLWSELFRLVCEVRPKWLLAENVPGLLSSDDGRFFGNILRDLASIGFDAEWGMLSAAGVGAPHLRRRVFILANPSSIRWGQGEPESKGQQRSSASFGSSPHVANATSDARRIINGNYENDVADSEGTRSFPARLQSESKGNARRRRSSDSGGEDLSDPMCTGWNGAGTERSPETEGSGPLSESARPDWWAIEPNVGRVAHGIPLRVDRLRCLGNAVVPQVAQKVGEMILGAEKEAR